jgi:transposase InsO family protein
MFKIEKLSESNFHVWKQKVELILAFRELDDHIGEHARSPSESALAEKWLKDDAKARAVIGLTLSDEHLEHVSDCKTAAEMWSAVIDLFQRKTLLNKLACRRRFYSAKMATSEKAIAFISRVRQLAADCKAMDVKVDEQDIAMTVLCGLPQRFEHLIVAIDAAADDDSLTMDFVKSRLLQEEQRMLDRGDIKHERDAALVNTSNESSSRLNDDQITECDHCKKKGHPESRCWLKYPHLRPKWHVRKQSGLVVSSEARPPEPESNSENVVCLIAGSMSQNVDRACRALWIIDSGATMHICHDKRMFAKLEHIEPFDISIGDKSGVKAIGRGSVDLVLNVSGKSQNCKLQTVFYAPTMGYNMLSVRAMSNTGYVTVFTSNDCSVKRGERIVAQGSVRNGLYYLNTATNHKSSDTPNLSTALAADLNLWHRRLGHVHVEGIRNMVRKNVVEGMSVDLKTDLTRCEACVYGKSSRAPIPQSGGARAKRALDLVHTDVCGPFPVASIGNSLYFVSFVDDWSRFAWVYAIQAKSDVFATFKKWLAMVENQEAKQLKVLQWSKRLKTLQSDNGGEYLSSAMQSFLEQRGIQHRLTTPNNPHQNGVAERLNRTLCDMVRTMLYHKQMPKRFWAEALSVVSVGSSVRSPTLCCRPVTMGLMSGTRVPHHAADAPRGTTTF